jgi:hypothetical protein
MAEHFEYSLKFVAPGFLVIPDGGGSQVLHLNAAEAWRARADAIG